MRAVAGFMVGMGLLAEPALSATWLEQKLKEMDRNICQNYKNVKCKHRGKAQPAPKAVVKPAPVDVAVEKKPDAAVPPPPQREAKVAVPKPRPKPVIAASAPEPEDKPPELKGTVIAKQPPPGAEIAKVEPGPPPAEQPVAETKTDMVEPPLPIPPPKPRAKPKLSAQVAVVVPRESAKADDGKAEELPTTGNCLSALAARQVKFNVITKPVGQGACQVRNPVQLVAQTVDDNTVMFPDQPILNCAFALQFTNWMREKGEPIASAAGTHVAKFYTGPGYQCRGRNGDNSAKISEHGYGNAIDIERMQMADGKLYLVEDVRSLFKPGTSTMKKMRVSACDYFTTVLGPGANAAHEKHFHFDMGKHGRSGTYKICE